MIIKESFIKQVGKQIPINEIQEKAPGIHMGRLCMALRQEGMNTSHDDKYLYVLEDLDLSKIADKLSNRLWLQKTARHRIFEDCKGCKYLDETEHLGKAWCKKWDTDIWNVSTPFPEGDNTVNKGCVPFRFFGYAPNVPMTQTQFHLEKLVSKDKDVVQTFVEAAKLNTIGRYFDDNTTFVGEFSPSAKFGIKYNADKKKIQMKVEAGKKTFEKEYDAEYKSVTSMLQDWKTAWNMDFDKINKIANEPSLEDVKEKVEKAFDTDIRLIKYKNDGYEKSNELHPRNEKTQQLIMKFYHPNEDIQETSLVSQWLKEEDYDDFLKFVSPEPIEVTDENDIETESSINKKAEKRFTNIDEAIEYLSTLHINITYDETENL